MNEFHKTESYFRQQAKIISSLQKGEKESSDKSISILLKRQNGHIKSGYEKTSHIFQTLREGKIDRYIHR